MSSGRRSGAGGGRSARLFYALPMPVSRKRKTRKSKKSSARATTPSRASNTLTTWYGIGSDPVPRGSSILESLTTHRRELDARRESLATDAANDLVTGLVALAPSSTGSDLEDELCGRMGPLLREWEDAPVEDHVNPEKFIETLIHAATAALRGSLEDQAAGEGWRAPWQVLTAVTRITPELRPDQVAATLNELRRLPGGRRLPRLPEGPSVVADQVLWTRDAYGSRFAVVAAVQAPEGHRRWYLWDIDACGFKTVTVYSTYFTTPEQAFAQWQSGVGQVAAEAAKLALADDGRLLADLLPAEEGFWRAGGESAEQLAEYHRSRRLAEAVLNVLDRTNAGHPTNRETVVADAVTEFTAWLSEHRPDEPQPDELAELIEELADSWCIEDPPALYHTCSPHRVALTVRHLRNYYLDDFAAQLVTLLPDWTAWLATRNGTPPELAERCLPYANGAPHPELDADDRDGPARIAE